MIGKRIVVTYGALAGRRGIVVREDSWSIGVLLDGSDLPILYCQGDVRIIG